VPGEAALAHLYYGDNGGIEPSPGGGKPPIHPLPPLPRRPWVSVSVLPSNFPLGEPVKRMGRTINEGALPEGQVVPSIGAAGHSMLEEAPLEATTNPGPDGVW